MELNLIDQYFINQPQQNQEVLIFLRQFILNNDSQFSEHWKYGTPFYYFKNKPFCYFHHNKKNGHPYIGLVRAMDFEHPLLERGNRKKMQVLELDPKKDLPLEDLLGIFMELKSLYY